MTKKRTILLFIGLSICIYILQILLFKEPRTTAFYIFQDMAFLPFTIAIATIAVGEYMSEKEKRERLEKIRMLTSTFFSEMGAKLLFTMYQSCESNVSLEEWLEDESVSFEDLKERIRPCSFHIQMSEELYNEVCTTIMDKQTGLLVISANPLLLEHEDFTNMLWGIFHLMDEFRLRGEYHQLSKSDISHFESDFSNLFHDILINWVSNVEYMKAEYPNYYNVARNKMLYKVKDQS